MGRATRKRERERGRSEEMAFFFKPARPKSAAEVVRSVKDSLLALDNNTVVDVKSLEKVFLSFFFVCINFIEF